MRSVTPFLSSEKLPEVGDLVIVAGGLARWIGSCWMSYQDNYPIQWPVLWWLPLLQDKDVMGGPAPKKFRRYEVIEATQYIVGQPAPTGVHFDQGTAYVVPARHEVTWLHGNEWVIACGDGYYRAITDEIMKENYVLDHSASG